MKTYLYAVSRRDLSLSQQCIQSSHAAIEHAYLYGRPLDHHPSLIYLTCADKTSLEALREKINSSGISTAEFHEPYQDWGLTAIACLLNEGQRHLLSDLPLWRIS